MISRMEAQAPMNETLRTRGSAPTRGASLQPVRLNLASGPTKLVILSLIVLASFALRLAALDYLPALLTEDESINGLDALLLWRSHRLTPFLQNNFGRETLFFYLQGIALQVFGISVFSLRYLSVFFGVLTIPLLYLTGRQLLVSKGTGDHVRQFEPGVVGLLAAAGLASSYWHIYFSRLALRAIMLPPILLLLIWAFWRGWFSDDPGRRRRCLVLAGGLLGLSLYTYLAARLLPLIFLSFVLIRLIENRSHFMRRLTDAAIFYGTSLVVSLPLLICFWRNPQAVSSRTDAISILSSNDPLLAMKNNLVNWLIIQFGSGLWLERWPALAFLSSLGLLVGLAFFLKHIRRPLSQFLLLWWLGGWVPMLLSQHRWDRQTTILRGIVAWPVVFLISAVGLVSLTAWIVRWWQAHKPTSTTSLRTVRVVWLALPMLLLLTNGASASRIYFSNFASTQSVATRARIQGVVEYLEQQDGEGTLVSNSLLTHHNVMIRFLLQSSYPNFTALDPVAMCTQLTGMIDRSIGIQIALPGDPGSHTAFSLLEASSEHNDGTIYLLPQLTQAQIGLAANHLHFAEPMAILDDPTGEAPIRILRLTPDVVDVLCQPRLIQPVQVDFGEQLRLTGYLVDPPTAKPGQPFTLSMQWLALQPMNNDYDIFIHVFGIDGDRIGQFNGPLGSMLSFTNHWWPVDVSMLGYHRFWVPVTAADGAYLFKLELFHRNSQERLPVTAGWGVDTMDDGVILGKLLVQSASPLAPQQLLNFHFAGPIDLVGADVFPESASYAPGEEVEVRLHWQSTRFISEDYTVFAHLVDSQGNIVWQHDNMPQNNRYPTSLWSQGEVVLDSYHLSLPANLPPDSYQLRVGLYLLETGQRVLLADGSADFAPVLEMQVAHK